VALREPVYQSQINIFTGWQAATNKVTKARNTEIWGIVVDDHAVETWFTVKRWITSHDIPAFSPIFK
jgi:hypothetical protein